MAQLTDSLIEVIIPSFINCHLFWIIPKKNLLLRSAINRILKTAKNIQIKEPDKLSKNKMVAVNIDDLWCRGVIDHVIEAPNNNRIKYICWLPDYAVMREVNLVFQLPEELKKCPHLAKQASLHNVVNLKTDLVLGEYGYEFKLKKTLEDIKGVSKVALDNIEAAEKLFFSVIDEDEFTFYGDVICLGKNNVQQSLTEFLVKKNLLGFDEEIFLNMESSRADFKEIYYKESRNWHKELDRTEKNNLSEIIFNKEENIHGPAMEFFKRKRLHSEITSNF